MDFDIVWFTKPAAPRALAMLSPVPPEERLSHLWRFGWTLWPCTPLPDAEGKLSKVMGYCVARRRLGITQIKPSATVMGKYKIVDCCKLEVVDKDIVGGRISPETWERPEIVKEAEVELQNITTMAKRMQQEDFDRQARNEARLQHIDVLRERYRRAVASMVGVPHPETTTSEILMDVYLLNQDTVPPWSKFIAKFDDEITPEPEPEFILSDDPSAFMQAAMESLGTVASMREVFKKV